MTPDKITIIRVVFKKRDLKNKGRSGLWRKTWSGADERNTGGEDCKAGEYRLVSAGGRGILDGGKTGILDLESRPQPRAFCWEVHPSLIEKQQIIFALIMEAVRFFIPGVPGLYARGPEKTRRGS